MSNIVLTVGRSLMYIINNKGPRTEPWDTPVVEVSLNKLRSNRHTEIFPKDN